MSVVSQEFIQSFYNQYDEGAPLWQQYEEIDRDKVLALIEKDRVIIRDMCLDGRKPVTDGKPIYAATAGAPLAGKSTIFEQKLAQDPEFLDNAVKVDPDRWGLLFMPNLYHGYLMAAGAVAGKNTEDYKFAQQRAYNIARPASNFITLEIMNEAFDKRLDVLHGTTMTNPRFPKLLGDIKGEGYDIDLTVVSADDDTRAQAQGYRSDVQGFYQSTPEDVKSKGLDFPQRLKDYFAHADCLDLYWRDDYKGDAKKTASYVDGVKQVFDNVAHTQFVNKYIEDRALLKREQGVDLPYFSDAEEAYIKRFDMKLSL